MTNVFFGGVGYGAYANTGLGEDDWDAMFKEPEGGWKEETAEDSLKMQMQMAKDAGMTEEEMKLDPEWARKHLSKNWFERLPIEHKLAVGGAVFGGALVLIFALKS